MHHYHPVTGQPVWEVPKVKGGGKKPTIWETRKGLTVPGVTTILGSWRAFQLEEWKVKQGILAALTCPNLYDKEGRLRQDLDEDQMIYIAQEDSKRQVREAADRGQAIHDAVETWLERGLVTPEYTDYVESVSRALEGLGIKLEDCRVEVPFAHPLGYGGRIDILHPEWIIDLKTKDFGPEDLDGSRVKIYDNHREQIVAYDRGTNQVADGRLYTMGHDKDEQKDHTWEVFKALLKTWQLKNKVTPPDGWTDPARAKRNPDQPQLDYGLAA